MLSKATNKGHECDAGQLCRKGEDRKAGKGKTERGERGRQKGEDRKGRKGKTERGTQKGHVAAPGHCLKAAASC